MVRKLANLIVVAAILFAGSALLLACGQNDQASPSPGEKTSTIVIRGFAFDPSNLTVEKGTKVTWLNGDYITYKIKSNLFESRNMTRGDTFSYTFNETGNYDYSEVANPSMKGRVTVT